MYVGVAPRLVELLGSATTTVQTPALRTVVHMSVCEYGTNEITSDVRMYV